LRERQTRAWQQLVGPEQHLNREAAATAALTPAEHPQASAQREFLRARRYLLYLQQDEQQPVAPLQERLQELAEAQDAMPEALQGVCLWADRPPAQNALDRPAAVRVSVRKLAARSAPQAQAWRVLQRWEALAQPDALRASVSALTSQLPQRLPARRVAESACAPARRARYQSSLSGSSFR
jgi:hypothetical protein